jgi:RNA polymerase sigma-70 factor (ECF subfamily)
MNTMDVSDETDLHERIIANDPSALAAWQEATRPKVLRYVQGKGLSPEDAEEIWNDAMYATIVKAPSLARNGSSLRKWAFKVAHHKAVDRLRTATEPPMSLDEGISDEPLVRPAVKPDPRRIEALRHCLAGLGERYRTALRLRSIGVEASEVAQVLEIAEASVYKVVQRAKQMMRDCITGRLGA